MRLRLLGCSLAALVACGGTAIIDPAATSSSSAGGGGTGGAPTTTSTSSSSSTGGGPDVCAELEVAYQQALDAAKTCASDITFPQCSELVDDQLGCPCPTSINPENGDAVDAMIALRDEWQDADCVVLCEDVECPEIQGTGCQNDTCVDFGND